MSVEDFTSAICRKHDSKVNIRSQSDKVRSRSQTMKGMDSIRMMDINGRKDSYRRPEVAIVGEINPNLIVHGQGPILN